MTPCGRASRLGPRCLPALAPCARLSRVACLTRGSQVAGCTPSARCGLTVQRSDCGAPHHRRSIDERCRTLPTAAIVKPRVQQRAAWPAPIAPLVWYASWVPLDHDGCARATPSRVHQDVVRSARAASSTPDATRPRSNAQHALPGLGRLSTCSVLLPAPLFERGLLN